MKQERRKLLLVSKKSRYFLLTFCIFVRHYIRSAPKRSKHSPMDKAHFEQLALRLRPKITALAERFFTAVERAEQADDVAQETLLRLWRLGDRTDGYRDIEALAVTIAKNVCVDLYRRGVPVAAPLDTVKIAIPSAAETRQRDEALHHALEKGLDQLPSTQRRMLVMRSEGMALEDIAAVCGTTKASAKTLISAARKSLMKSMKGENR